MTELVSPSEMQIGYEKFLQLRERQKQANTKYRSTEKGKIKTNEMHRIWTSKKRDDVEYIAQTNMKARERYHIRKAKKTAEKDKSSENTSMVDSLGESENQEKETKL
jgi:REP element-mobilizing transposase RayT